MRIDILTLFPEMCDRVLDESIIGRARRQGLFEVHCHNIRDYTLSKQKRVDDAPYGGGMGMVMQADPIFRCYEAVWKQIGMRPHVIYLSPQGETFTQQKAISLKDSYENIVLLCGHYEGVDERVLKELVDEEISAGDFVLTGGELPALMVADSILRMLPGVLSDESCFTEESHFKGLLEYPHYSRPALWHGKEVPQVLLSGHHANITLWRRQESLRRTLKKRPDMLTCASLDKKDKAFLASLAQDDEKSGQA